MDKETMLGTLARFRKILTSQNIRVDKLVLYGSWASGMANEDSDIDVIVVSRDFAGKSYWERIEILSDAIYKIFKPIEAVAMTPEEWEAGDSLFLEAVKHQGTLALIDPA